MPQLLRPNSNITLTGITGGFADIDEVTPSDSDYAYGANGGGNVFEVGLSAPSSTPASGTATLRVRLAEIQSGTKTSFTYGNADPVTLEILEGATVRYTTTVNLTSTWTTSTFSPDLSSVTNWSDLRLRFKDKSHSTIFFDVALGVSWAELEVADGGAGGVTGDVDFSVAGPTHDSSGTLDLSGAFASTIGAPALASSGTLDLSGSSAFSIAGPTHNSSGALDLSGDVALAIGEITPLYNGDSDIGGTIGFVISVLSVSISGIKNALKAAYSSVRLSLGLGL